MGRRGGTYSTNSGRLRIKAGLRMADNFNGVLDVDGSVEVREGNSSHDGMNWRKTEQ